MKALTSVYWGVESTPGPLRLHMTWFEIVKRVGSSKNLEPPTCAGGLLSEMQERLRLLIPSSRTEPPSTLTIFTLGLSARKVSKSPSLRLRRTKEYLQRTSSATEEFSLPVG